MVLRTDGRTAHCSAPYRHGFLYTYFKQAQKHVTCSKEASDRVHFKEKIETGFPHGSSGRLSRSNYSNLMNSSDDIQHRQQVRGSRFFFFLNFNPKHLHCSLSEFDPQCPRFTHSTQQWRVNADRPCVLIRVSVSFSPLCVHADSGSSDLWVLHERGEVNMRCECNPIF